MLRVCVSGAAGRMGRNVLKAIAADPELEIAGGADPVAGGGPISSLGVPSDAMLLGSLSQCIATTRPDIIVDFSIPDAVRQNIRIGLEAGVHMVVGTTGIAREELAEFNDLMNAKGANLFVAPNFAIGAILMMHFAEIAAKYYPDAEIIELHHNAKADAPSGTSLKTAAQIAAARTSAPQGNPGGREIVPGARGADVEDIRIHSVRLPGLVAHQEVIFGGEGETLSVRHDSMDRTSFMKGVILAVKAVPSRPGLTYGLENILEF